MLIATFVGIMVLSTGVRAYAAEAFVVPSGSMLPTLQIGDRLIVDKLSSTVHRGDIIVFRRAPGDHDSEYADLVKRVIGLPGETIPSVGERSSSTGSPGRALAAEAHGPLLPVGGRRAHHPDTARSVLRDGRLPGRLQRQSFVGGSYPASNIISAR